MVGCPFRFVLSVVVCTAFAGCGLSGVGPDLDAWQAHQAAKAAHDGDGAGQGGGDAGADTLAPDSGGPGDAADDEAAGSDLDGDDGGPADDADAAADDLDDATPGSEDLDEVGDDAVDVAEVATAPPCKTESDCPPPPDLCQIRECAQGFCKFSPKQCPPGADACDLSACATATGDCVFGSAPAGTNCDDGSPCSKASACDGGGACVSSDMAGCDDGNPCTSDQCIAGTGGLKCSSDPPDKKKCDDGNSCTADSCGVGTCTHDPLPNATDCSDGNACTTGDLCAAGKCNAGAPLVCGTGTTCKPVTCEPTAGCSSPVDGTPDGTPCKQPGGVCSSGTCIQGWAPAMATGPVHACAWAVQDTVACWGSNKSLALGVPDIADSVTPTFWSKTDVQPKSVAVGGGFVCRANQGMGKLFCRGENDHGQLGQAPGPPSATEVSIPLPQFVEWAQVVAGDDHACALDINGKARCWGAGAAGQLGKLGLVGDESNPVEVSFAGKFSLLAAGGNNTCGLVEGEAYCWGSNGVSWADGTTKPKVGVPAKVKTLQSFVALAVGENHACGLTQIGGEVWCWGKNDAYQLGAQDNMASVAKLPLPNLQSVAVGISHTCVVSTAGAVSCFGSNSKQQKGPGANAVPDNPNLEFLKKAKAVSAAGDATCVLMANMSIQCFGVGPDGNPTPPYIVPGSVGLKLE
ncbi:MAG: hypothetical protein FJ100_05410 [Deltaproteobacteria bacterium]|nr:hypothetical protein [Deltaproteobacteria bacterium]